MLRKKRVTISEQAQAAIASGMPVDQAIAEHGTVDPAPAVELVPPAEPAAETPAVEPTAETPAVEPAAETPAVEPELSGGDPVEPATPAVDSTTTELLNRLQETQNTVATQAASITQLEAAAVAATATHEALMGIAIEAVNRMQIGLGGPATDLSSLSAENLLAQYRSTLTLVEERFPVGGKAEVPVDDNSHAPGKVVPLVSPAVARATQFRK
jgi:hypothetical protein